MVIRGIETIRRRRDNSWIFGNKNMSVHWQNWEILRERRNASYISQPALSIYITNLEKNLGIPLFDRSGKKFTLTYAGEQYVEKAKKMLELEREFCEDIEKITRETAGRIRLGISRDAAVSFYLR